MANRDDYKKLENRWSSTSHKVGSPELDAIIATARGGDYGLSVQRGLIEGVSSVHIFGRNPDIDTSDGFESVWNGGGIYNGLNATQAEPISISSSSTEDTDVTGNGAWQMVVSGLDANLNEISEVVSLNGTNEVVTVNSFFRCTLGVVLSAGSTGYNVGNITAKQIISTDVVFFIMPIESNRTLVCAYTVPAGKMAYVTSGFATLARKGNATSEIKFLVRPPGSVFSVVEWFAVDGGGTSYIRRDFNIPLVGVPAGTDILANADTDTNNTGIAAGLEIYLVDE